MLKWLGHVMLRDDEVLAVFVIWLLERDGTGKEGLRGGLV